ncbi:MAG: ferrous iron transporter B, partial [Tissierellia bacterium]|nr:ferrous iron transporter B [Tissierellia bacterium]
MLNLKLDPNKSIIALAGNPNTGKSTIFNSLTDLNQHTGNWPGKTVNTAYGDFTHNGKEYLLVDLPGTYSLLSNSEEEEIARDFICFANPHVTVVVTDATCLERNLNLALQVMEITHRVIICVNLMDEAQRKKIKIDCDKLSKLLGVPVVATVAREGKGLDHLKNTIEKLIKGDLNPKPIKVDYGEELERAIEKIRPLLEKIANGLNTRWLALRLLEGDRSLIRSIKENIGYDIQEHELLKDLLEEILEELKGKGLDRNKIRDMIVSSIVRTGEAIYNRVAFIEDDSYRE